MRRHEDLESPRNQASGRRPWAVVTAAWVVLVIGVTISLIAAFAWGQSIDRRAVGEQRTAASRASALVASNLELNDNLMVQLRAMLNSSPDIDNTRFRAWWDAAEVAEHFPGGMGFGFVERVPASEAAAFGAAREADPVLGLGTGEFAVMTHGTPDEYCLQRVGIWESTDVQGFEMPPGFDYCAAKIAGDFDSPLPEVLAAATDSGRAAIVLPEDFVPGLYVVMLPVYEGGVTPATVEARRAASVGWVAGSFQAESLTASAVAMADDLALTVRHRDGDAAPEVVAATHPDRAVPGNAVVDTTEIGSGWVIEVVAGPGAANRSMAMPIAALLGGITLTVLAFLFIRVLGTSRERALDLVEERTHELEHRAMHDALTGLPNRSLIIDRAEVALARARRHGTEVAALFIDLDDFKAVNDTLGHGAGDQLLRTVAERLVHALRASDTVGRLGGDEFVVLLGETSLGEGVEVVARRLLEILDRPVEIEGEPRQVGASIGISLGVRDDAESLLRDADIALYEAKEAGKGRWALYRPDMGDAVQGRVSMEQDLRDALDDGRLFLEYQPMVRLRDEEVFGVEALLRWSHPTDGVVPPDRFIPTAERTGLIVPIGRWVLEEACRRGAEWQAIGHPLVVSVNLSARQFDDAGLVDDVRRTLEESGLAPGSLLLEITETALMADLAVAQRRLVELKELGVRVAIDDFGTGYSSLAYLRRFPVDVLKIDRSFVAGIAESDEAGALVGALMEMGRALGLEVLGEGIEERSQLAVLAKERCDSGQGFLFARPMAAEAVDRLLGIPTHFRTLAHAGSTDD